MSDLGNGLLEELCYNNQTNPIKVTVVHPFIVNTGNINKPSMM
jgi:hypothetical protein